MTTEKTFKVSEEDNDKRIDVYLTEQLGISRSKIKRFFDNGQIFLNNLSFNKASQRLKEGDRIEVKFLEQEHKKKKEKDDTEIIIPDIPLIAETEDYLIINKPAGVLVHPTDAKEPDTLVAWLLKNYPEVEGVGEHDLRPGIVHRIDKAVSGLLVIPRNKKMHAHLKKQFKAREIEKEYSALVYGEVEADTGLIDFPIDRGNDGHMVSRPMPSEISLKSVKHIQTGKEAITTFKVEKRFVRYTLLKVKILTGRTHQIRVHFFAYNHPIVGDVLYGNRKLIKKHDKILPRIFLHATKLCFDDLKGERVCFNENLPAELEEWLSHIT